jgi:hypothetical protein
VRASSTGPMIKNTGEGGTTTPDDTTSAVETSPRVGTTNVLLLVATPRIRTKCALGAFGHRAACEYLGIESGPAQLLHQCTQAVEVLGMRSAMHA